MDLKPPEKSDLRNFGLIMAAAISILGLIRWSLHGFSHFPANFVLVAALFFILGLILPNSLGPAYWVWMRFALVLNWIVTRILLISIFYLMILPGRIILMIRRKDPLKRQWNDTAETYWEEPEEQPAEFERYLNQF